VPRSLDLNALIGEMAEMLQRTLGGTVKVETALVPQLWSALVDPSQLELVLLNLAINARDAMPRGGSLRITTANLTVNEVGRLPGCRRAIMSASRFPIAVRACPTPCWRAPASPSSRPRGPARQRPRIGAVYGFARQSGGGLVIDSAIDEGTTVTVYLPRAGAGSGATRDGVPAVQTRGDRALTVLVVDDQSDVRDIVAAYLETLGFGWRKRRRAIPRSGSSARTAPSIC